MLFQSPEDYSENYIRGSLTRLLRYICAFASLVLPAFYISVSAYHPEMLPVDMAAAIVRSKQGVPFPPALEVIFMLVAFEVLIESGLRLPKAIGQTISIVGGLVVGDAAASAKFVSPIVVVIIAITAICGFVTPNQDLSNAFRLLRLCFVIFAAAAGLFGMSVGIVLLIYYLCTRSSFGYPFMEAYATKNGKMRLRDGLFRFPVPDSHKKKGETP
jgi:spore germination protein KA